MSHSSICALLRSDKVTWRLRGKDRLKELAARDRVQVCFSNEQWWEVTQALLQYETKELSYSRAKNKEQNHENAIFFKMYIKQGLQCSLLSAKRVLRVLKHVLIVLHDEELKPSYHREYLDCLLDVLETPKVNRYVQSPRILTAIFNYLRRSHVPSTPSPLLLRLLKALCRVIYLEPATESGILVELLDWMAATLAAAREALPPSSSKLTSVVAALCCCYSSILEQHGSNCFFDICSYVNPLLDAVVQQLPLQTVPNRDPLLIFLTQFYGLSVGTVHHSMLFQHPARHKRMRDISSFSLAPHNPLNFHTSSCNNLSPSPSSSSTTATPNLSLFYSLMVEHNQGEFLRALLTGGGGGSGSSVGGVGSKGSSAWDRGRGHELHLHSFVNFLEDGRFALNMRAVALTLCLLQGQEQQQEEKNKSPVLSVSSTSLNTQNDFQSTRKFPITALYLSILSLSSCFGGGEGSRGVFTQTSQAQSLRHATQKQTRLETQVTCLSQVLTQGGGGGGISGWGQSQVLPVLLESKVYLLVALCRLDMEGGQGSGAGSFLLHLDAAVSPPSSSSSLEGGTGTYLKATTAHESKVINLSKWLLLLRHVLLQAIRGRGGGQLVGVLLLALVTLLKLSRAVLLSPPHPPSTGGLMVAIEQSLRSHWAETLHMLAGPPSSSSSSVSLAQLLFISCRHQSLATVLMQLFTTALAPRATSKSSSVSDCLIPPSTWFILQQRVWEALAPLCLSFDPRSMDCPQLFCLLTAFQRPPSVSASVSSESSCNITLLSKIYLSHLDQCAPNSVVFGLYQQWLHSSCAESCQPTLTKTSLSGSEGFFLLVAWLESFLLSQQTASNGSGGGSGRLFVLQHLDQYLNAFASVTRAAFVPPSPHSTFLSSYYSGEDEEDAIITTDGITASGRMNVLDKSLLRRLQRYRHVDALSHCSKAQGVMSPPHGCEESASTLPTALFSASAVQDYVQRAARMLELCSLLLQQLQKVCTDSQINSNTSGADRDSESSNVFLSQWQLVVLLLSSLPLVLLQQVPPRAALQIAYSRSDERERHKYLLRQLRGMIERAHRLFWTCQEALFQVLARKSFLFRGNGNTSIVGCAAYHTKCMEVCSAAFIETKRLRLILQDMTDVGVTSSSPLFSSSTFSSTRSHHINGAGDDNGTDGDSADESDSSSRAAAEMQRYLSIILRDSSPLCGGGGVTSRRSAQTFARSSCNAQRGRSLSPHPLSLSRSSSNSSSNSSATLPVSFGDEDEDAFMEKQSSTTSHSQASPREMEREDEVWEEGQGAGLFRLSFSRDQVQMLSASICCFLAASMAPLTVGREQEGQRKEDGEELAGTLMCTRAVEQVMATLTAAPPPGANQEGNASELLDDDHVVTSYAYKLPSEVALMLAEQMTSLAYPSPAIHAFIVQNSWAEDWGVLGFQRVLGVVLRLTAQEDYFVPFLRSSSAQVQQEYRNIFALVFGGPASEEEEEERSDEDDGDDDSGSERGHLDEDVISQLPQFLREHWGNRVLQLECGANIFKASPQIYKREFGDVLLRGLIDADTRVNEVAVALLPLIFQHLPLSSHLKVYQSVRRYVSLDDTLREAVWDHCDRAVSPATLMYLDRTQKEVYARKEKRYSRLQEEVASKMCALSACGLASVSLLPEVLRDLLLLHAVVNPAFSAPDFADNEKGGGGASSLSNNKSSQPMEEDEEEGGHLLGRRQVHFSVLAEALVEALSGRHGYSSPRLLLRDHLHFLLGQWLAVVRLQVEVDGDDKEGEEEGGVQFQEQEMFLPLSAFPFAWLGYESFQEFLLQEGNLLLPLICQLTPPQHRWEQLRRYAHATGAGAGEAAMSEDQAIALVVRRHIAAIRGAELCLANFFFSYLACLTGEGESWDALSQVSGTNSDTAALPSSSRPGNHDEEAHYMSQLVARVTSAEETQRYLLNNQARLLAEVVEYILCSGGGVVWGKLSDVSSATSKVSLWDRLALQGRLQHLKAEEGVNRAGGRGMTTKSSQSIVMTCYSRFDKALAAVLDKTAILFNKRNKTDLLLHADLITTLGRLKLLLHSSQCEYKKTCYAFTIHYLGKYVSSKLFLDTLQATSFSSSKGCIKRLHSVELLTRAMLSALTATLQRAPVLLDAALLSLHRMADTCSASLSLSLGQGGGGGGDKLRLGFRLASCLPDLFAEVVCAICALNLGLVTAFVSSTRTTPGLISSPSFIHRGALEAGEVLDQCMPHFCFVTDKYGALVHCTAQLAQEAMAEDDCSPHDVGQSAYVGHSSEGLISTYSCKSLRKVLLKVLSCDDMLRLAGNELGGEGGGCLLSPLAQETTQLLFLDWECMQEQYTHLARGDLESCSLIEELQGRLVPPPSSFSGSREMMMQVLVWRIWQYLQGSLVSKSLLWLQLVLLRESLQPQNITDWEEDGGKGQRAVSVSVRVVAALLALGRSEREEASGSFTSTSFSLQHDMAYIAGSLGFQDKHSVKHNGLSLSTRILEVDKGLQVDDSSNNNAQLSNVNSQLAYHPTYLKLDVVASKVIYFVYEAGGEIAEEAIRAIHLLQDSGALLALRAEVEATSPASNAPRGKGLELQALAVSSTSVHLALAVLGALSTPGSDEGEEGERQLYEELGVGVGEGERAGGWSEAVWSSAGKVYSTWITTLVTALIHDCYPSSSSGPSRPGRARGVRGSAKEGLFMRSLLRLTACSAQVAEALFPLLLLDVLENDKRNSGDSFTASQLIGDHLQRHLLKPDPTPGSDCQHDPPLLAATRLGCQTLVFLFRRQVTLFRQREEAGKKKQSSSVVDEEGEGAKATKKRPLKVSQTETEAEAGNCGSPYSFGLPVDFSLAAAAAVRCGCICTAALFVELAGDESLFYWQRDQEESPPPPDTDTSTAGDIEGGAQKRQALEAEAGEISCKPRSSASASTLALTLRQGFTAASKRSCFSRLGPVLMGGQGEGLLRGLFQRLHDPDACLGVPACTNHSLAAQAKQYAHTGQWQAALGTYQCMLQLPGAGAGGEQEARVGVAESLRALGYQQLLQEHVSHMSSNSEELLSALAGEAVWRQILFDNTADSGSRQLYWDGNAAGTAAMINLNRWPDYLDTPDPYTFTHSQNWAQGGALRPKDYFSNALCASIRALGSGEGGSAASTVRSRVFECTRLLFPALLEEGQKEGRSGLMLDLMRLQQLVEVQEAAACLGGGAREVQPALAGGKSLSLAFAQEEAVRPLAARREVSQVLDCWRRRMSGGSALNDSVCCENLLALRLALLVSLPSSIVSSTESHSRHLLQFLHQVLDVAGGEEGSGGEGGEGTREGNATRLVSPLLYKVRNLLFDRPAHTIDTAIDIGTVGPGASKGTGFSCSKVARAEFALFESRMLWKKELHEVAVTSLQEHVIEPLTDVLLAASQSSTNSTHSAAEDMQTSVRSLLSEAYRSTGEWMAARRTRSGLTVLRQYLEPSVALASPCQIQQQIKTHLTLATWHLHMHKTVQARVTSLEWTQGQKLSQERKEELEQCKEATKDLQRIYISLGGKDPSRSKGGKLKQDVPMTEELAAAHQKMLLATRHFNVLKRELAIDEKERRDVELSVQSHLIQSLHHYRSVLVLSPASATSSTARSDTVFHVIHLWFNSSHLPEVNDIMQDIIHRAPSFQFVSLHYQIMSRLDGSASETLLRPPQPTNTTTSSSLKRASPVSSPRVSSDMYQVQFQNSLTKLLVKLGIEHPYHILPQLFALMHDKLSWENIESYDLAVIGSSAATTGGGCGGRSMAAHTILHAVKHHFHLQAQVWECSDSSSSSSSGGDGGGGERFSGRGSDRGAVSVFPLTHLVEGMGTLLVQYVKLALTNVDNYVQSKRTKRIRFTELVGGRRGTAFHECLNGVQMQRSGAVGVVGGDGAGNGSKNTKKRLSSASKGSSCGSHLLTSTFHTADFHIAVITKHHRILPDGRYFPYMDPVSSLSSPSCSSAFESSGVTCVHGFSPEFSLTDDGLSRPKIIKCLGSDGRSYTQLVKGGDDTRQDSVMEQVFGHVNRMLCHDQACQQRQLKIRTYNVVPTTPQSGIIEWVENTIPFGSYLCERPRDSTLGAHSRYHPEDLKSSEVRALMNEAKDKSSEEKERVFLELCRQFRPAFRYFFLETFSDPSDWLDARIAYTRGVAATSMVGYILGIGDRHAHNILVDTVTAEVVHIDFGIMFEQGKVIATPETVPFRLTRDVVDGMGVAGVEGTFRKCCEQVLRVLRMNLSQLVTILEVVMHDPLYKWSLSPVQLQARRRRQQQQTAAGGGAMLTQQQLHGHQHTAGGGSSSSQDAAQRALLRIQNKLQGYEDPSGQSMSITGQVQHVIAEARDPKNLCKLFTGWTQWV